MFKKMILIGLALLITASMGTQAASALAQGSPSSVTGVPPVVQAEIKHVVGLQDFPLRIRVTGTLPAGCYKLKVSTPVVRKPNPDTSITPIIVRVRGIWLRGTVCTQTLQRFATTVTIDPLQLNLAPGRYVVRFNPLRGRTRHRIGINIPFGPD